jgi:uncharacterized membrane protein (UPF0182 family)
MPIPFPSYDGGADGPRVIDVGRRRRRRRRLALLAVILVAVLSAALVVSWYVEALWFHSLGFSSVFWRTLACKAGLFAGFAMATLLVLAGGFWAIRPRRLGGRTVLVNGQPMTFSLGPLVTIAGWSGAALVAVISGSSMMERWTTFGLYWNRPIGAAQLGAAAGDPIFGRPLDFYLFTLPVLQLLATWASTLVLILVVAAFVMLMVTEGEQVLTMRRMAPSAPRPFGPLSFVLAAALAVLAVRVFLARYDALFAEHTVFSGATYTDAHVLLPGLVVVAGALLCGAVIAMVNGFKPRRLAGLMLAVLPALVTYAGVRVVASYVSAFVVKPNELVRETPFIRHNIEFTLQAFNLARVEPRAFAVEPGIEAIDVDRSRPTLENIRLWEWRALQDTLRQLQEIRTYYDFPDIDIDRYRVGGEMRQVMVAARELSMDKLPESSRNWINEKLIYTHGYGVTMNPVNGVTSDGLPALVLADMPVHSTVPDLQVTRPEIYFGQLTNSDVYVRTAQKEFNYPQGESNSYTTYEGQGGIPIGSWARRLLIAFDRGDLSKLPFSDDVRADSLLLMRRNIHDRVAAVAPFLVYDDDPYVVVGTDGHLYWIMDAFTTSDAYPYAHHYRVASGRVNYIRNAVKVVIDAYEGTVTYYVFDPQDPIAAAYRRWFPVLFRDADEMPAGLREHARYPELLLAIQGAVYSLYHMRDPAVFYNREDLWTVASELTMSETREQVARPLEPNFVLMQLDEAREVEFIAILPFTPSNRNNLISWIAGRSDGAAYGSLLVYDFPKTRLIDGPLQVEARIDQNPQISSMLTLWNQQGSHTRRGGLLVIPVERGLLYAESIYLQAERSPMPQLRLVVLALQDHLGFGTTFGEAMTSLFGDAASQRTSATAQAGAAALATATGLSAIAPTPPGAARVRVSAEVQALITQAASDLSDYQRLTAEGRLAEAGKKLESVKRALDQLAALSSKR